MEQYDSYLLQALATTGLISALANTNYLDEKHFNELKFDNESLKDIVKLSGIENPATLQMFLYALLVVPYELNKNHELNMKFNELNQFIEKYIINSQSNYPDDKNGIKFVKHIRNSISHSKCSFNSNDSECFITFFDHDDSRGRSYKCDFTIRTEDIGKLLEEIQFIIFDYFKNKYPDKCY